MAKLEITIATWDYDRVRPIMDGRVKIEGCDINFIKVSPEECFHRAWYHQDFDVTEIGLVPGHGACSFARAAAYSRSGVMASRSVLRPRAAADFTALTEQPSAAAVSSSLSCSQ